MLQSIETHTYRVCLYLGSIGICVYMGENKNQLQSLGKVQGL